MTSVLPMEKSVPETALSKYIVMIYGRPGIGKTTLAAQFEDPLFLMFEPGAKSLSVYRKEITRWEMFQEILEELDKTKRFQTLVIDTLRPAYELCLQYMSKKNRVSHISEIPYRGWDMLNAEFTAQMRRVGLMGRGLVLVSHAADKDIERHDGSVKSMVAPNLSKQAMQFVSEGVDVLAYYHYSDTGKRFIRIVDNGVAMAKNRIKGHFVGITKFEAGKNEEETYERFIAAFNNKLEVKESTNGQDINGRKHQGLLLKRNK